MQNERNIVNFQASTSTNLTSQVQTSLSISQDETSPNVKQKRQLYLTTLSWILFQNIY